MMSYAIIILIIIALSEMLKRLGIVPAKIIPLFNAVFSICFLLSFYGFNVRRGFISGCVIGIFITGLHSTVKNTLECVAACLKRRQDLDTEIYRDTISSPPSRYEKT